MNTKRNFIKEHLRNKNYFFFTKIFFKNIFQNRHTVN